MSFKYFAKKTENIKKPNLPSLPSAPAAAKSQLKKPPSAERLAKEEAGPPNRTTSKS